MIGGAVFMAAVDAGGATLLPIDSEHNAIFQCLPPGTRRDPGSRACAASCSRRRAGPFRTRAARGARAGHAGAKPARIRTGSWGRKISVDSATMMNKGLEVIEAHWLFGAPRTAIEVVIHPESVIHSLVEYVDGSVLAQLGQSRHAHADRTGAGVSRPHRRGRRRARARARGNAHVRGARSRALPLPRARLRGARGGRHGAGGAQRRERSRGRGVSRWRASATPTSPPRARKRWRGCRRSPCALSTTRSPPMPRPARSRAHGSSFRPNDLRRSSPDGHRCRNCSPFSSCSACWSRSTSSAISGSRGCAASRCCAFRSASDAWCGRAAFGPDRTEWAVSAVPLGGYVKMADEREGDVAAADLDARVQPPERLRNGSRSSPQGRSRIWLLAALLFAGTFVIGVPGQRAILAAPPSNTPAAAAGVREGDLVVAVDGGSVAQLAGPALAPARSIRTPGRRADGRAARRRRRRPASFRSRRWRPPTGKAISCRRSDLRRTSVRPSSIR